MHPFVKVPRKEATRVLQDLLRFYAFAFLLQLLLFLLYAAKVSEHPTSTKAVIDRVINVFISAAPTGAPTVVVAGLAYCVVHLRNKEVVVLLPEKIKTIADVEVVCFDKTGTLTGTMVSSCLVAGLLCPFPFIKVNPAHLLPCSWSTLPTVLPFVWSILPTACLWMANTAHILVMLLGQPCLLACSANFNQFHPKCHVGIG